MLKTRKKENEVKNTKGAHLKAKSLVINSSAFCFSISSGRAVFSAGNMTSFKHQENDRNWEHSLELYARVADPHSFHPDPDPAF
jgi:hypothetical protein